MVVVVVVVLDWSVVIVGSLAGDETLAGMVDVAGDVGTTVQSAGVASGNCTGLIGRGSGLYSVPSDCMARAATVRE